MPKSKRKNLKVRILAKRKAKMEDVVTAIDQEKIERDKRLFMRIGIGCIMAVFFIAWIINLKYQFKANAGKTAQSGLNWNQTKTQWAEAMAQVKGGIAEIKQLQKTAGSTAKEAELTSQQIDLLKGKLINEASSTVASSTIKN